MMPSKIPAQTQQSQLVISTLSQLLSEGEVTESGYWHLVSLLYCQNEAIDLPKILQGIYALGSNKEGFVSYLNSLIET